MGLNYTIRSAMFKHLKVSGECCECIYEEGFLHLKFEFRNYIQLPGQLLYLSDLGETLHNCFIYRTWGKHYTIASFIGPGGNITQLLHLSDLGETLHNCFIYRTWGETLHNCFVYRTWGEALHNCFVYRTWGKHYTIASFIGPRGNITQLLHLSDLGETLHNCFIYRTWGKHYTIASFIGPGGNITQLLHLSDLGETLHNCFIYQT